MFQKKYKPACFYLIYNILPVFGLLYIIDKQYSVVNRIWVNVPFFLVIIILTRNWVNIIITRGKIMEYSDIYVKRILTLCKKRGFTVNKLATISNINQSTLDNIVRGNTNNPRIKTLHKIAIAFNMTLANFSFQELRIIVSVNDLDSAEN